MVVEVKTMRNIGDAWCNYSEAITVLESPALRKQYRNNSVTARYEGTDIATGERIKPGDQITRLGTGWTKTTNLGNN